MPSLRYGLVQLVCFHVCPGFVSTCFIPIFNESPIYGKYRIGKLYSLQLTFQLSDTDKSSQIVCVAILYQS